MYNILFNVVNNNSSTLDKDETKFIYTSNVRTCSDTFLQKIKSILEKISSSQSDKNLDFIIDEFIKIYNDDNYKFKSFNNQKIDNEYSFFLFEPTTYKIKFKDNNFEKPGGLGEYEFILKDKNYSLKKFLKITKMTKEKLSDENINSWEEILTPISKKLMFEYEVYTDQKYEKKSGIFFRMFK